MTASSPKRLPYVIPVVVFAVLAAFFAVGLQLDPRYTESPLVCQPASEFSLPDLADPSRQMGSADFAGRMVILNVWAQWCVPCRQEHPYLLELARNGVPIYGVNWNDDPDVALAWLNEYGNPFVASGSDPDGEVGIKFGVTGAPETFLISPDMTILEKHSGPLTPEIWAGLFLPAMEAQCEDD